ncbi:hypothetical protein [Neorhizobium galegae]|uniref:hypothetical protein n=1 Tax=Neorhizobium galegae TaxID=399 RepID=UPI0006227868|nr:hypothetical protein [Neorhizobium galegae]CDZ28212.1 Hypothetical protein NGAL_HAMBI490_30700 [Neorhizobium galegae bv. officinalis]KAA9387997.1 hypothetical protein F4V88_16805 [Neorhizobium galegae]KAB1115542.1 hypothetical protein F4V89_03725 [Neorhizobium galegae]MCM2501134.1 hypothetical protein [Neorhizobium galegae]MCQ1773447.1 hypothetical protein [Neorhizobium galegae]
MPEERTAQEVIEHRGKPVKTARHSPAGPYAKEHLIDREKTPGAGSLAEPNAKEVETGSD